MKNLILGAGILTTAIALSLPLLAQERDGGMKDREGSKEKIRHEEVNIDKPYVEVSSKLPNAVEKAGLILLADVDWARFKGGARGTMPGGHRLEGVGTVSQIKSFFICDENYVNKVMEEPHHALWAPAIAVCEKGGKTCLLYFKPTAKLEELKKHGVITPEKYEEHLERAKQFEKKLDEVIETLRGTRSS